MGPYPCLELYPPLGEAYPLQQALVKLVLVLHVYELELDGRTSAVDDKNLHEGLHEWIMGWSRRL